MEAETPKPAPIKILSIQSHVTHGFVGNSVSVFPLQYLGHSVDSVNTVSYTSMYIHEGHKLQAFELRKVFLGLSLKKCFKPSHPGALDREFFQKVLDEYVDIVCANQTKNVLKEPKFIQSIDYDYIITGYMGTPEILLETYLFLKAQKQALGSKFLWVCDPVMGDKKRFYVPESMLEPYKLCLPFVDILTPNEFELGWLCDEEQRSSVEQAKICCRKLHKLGIPKICVTSVGNDEGERFPPKLAMLVSTIYSPPSRVEISLIEYDKLPINLGGTGDLFTALLVHHLSISDFKSSCLYALNVLHTILRASVEDSCLDDLDVIKYRNFLKNPRTDWRFFFRNGDKFYI